MLSKTLSSVCMLFLMFQTLFAGIDFGTLPLCAGKHLLTEKGFCFFQTLGTARFTAQAEIPVLLSYKSTNEKTGIFGKGWRSHLLESSLSGDLWNTPWGETVKLSENGGRFRKVDRVICGSGKYEGWEFLYLFGKLQKIITPNRKELVFIYEGPEERISAVRIRNFDFIRLFYRDKLVVRTVVGGVTAELKYRNRELLRSIQISNLHPTEFRYNGKKKLIQISRKDYVDKLSLNSAGELLGDRYYSYEQRKDGIRLTDRAGSSRIVTFRNHLLRIEDDFGNHFAIQFLKRHDPAYLSPPATVHVNGKAVLETEYYPHTEQPSRMTDRFGNRLLIAYDERGLPLKYSRQMAGEKIEIPFRKIVYNRLRLPVKIVELAPDGNVRSEMDFSYDDERQIKEMKTKKQNIRFRYNPFGYVNAMSGPHGDFQRFYYDGFNRKIFDVGVLATSMVYNNAGLLSEFRTITAEDKIVSGGRITYDFYGNPALVKLHDGRIIKYERDAFGRILKQHHPDGHSISYEYDASGNLEKVIDPNGHVLKFIYAKNRLMKQITPVGQVTEYNYNSFGQPISVVSYFADNPKKIDRKLTYQYDVFNRISEIDFGGGYIQKHQYDRQNRMDRIQRISPEESRSAALTYDREGRLLRREECVRRNGDAERKIIYSYEYDDKGRRTLFSVQDGKKERTIEYAYNEDGFLEEILSENGRISYEYEDGRLVKEIVNDVPISYQFDVLGRMISKKIGTAELKYFWSPEGRLTGRDFAGERQLYFYDKMEQLAKVTDNRKNVLESYKYDPAGNLIETFVHGVKSTFWFDKANQLRSSQTGKKGYRYQYDAAGRMISNGYSKWKYGWLNSVVKVDQTSYFYDTAGQLASAGNETFLWDDLALMERNGMLILNTPSMTGGNPVLVGEKIIFHDMLGSSVGLQGNKQFSVFRRSGFGELKESVSSDFDYFTGKPKVDGLGYHFLFRNYVPMTGKWTSSDPLGYPDGWNNFSYVQSNPIMLFDKLGNSSENLNQRELRFLDTTNSFLNMDAEISLNKQKHFRQNFYRLKKPKKVLLVEQYQTTKAVGKFFSALNFAQDLSHGFASNGMKGMFQEGTYSAVMNFTPMGSFSTLHSMGEFSLGYGSFYLARLISKIPGCETLPETIDKNLAAPVTDAVSEIMSLAKDGWNEIAGMIYDQLLYLPPETRILNRLASSVKYVKKHKETNHTVEQKQIGTDYTVEIPDHVRRVQIRVSDFWDEDGDVVAIHQQGKPISKNFVILHTPKSFILPVSGGDIEVRAIKDGGGGGVTYAIEILIESAEKSGNFELWRSACNRAQPGTANRYTLLKTSEKELFRGGGDE